MLIGTLSWLLQGCATPVTAPRDVGSSEAAPTPPPLNTDESRDGLVDLEYQGLTATYVVRYHVVPSRLDTFSEQVAELRLKTLSHLARYLNSQSNNQPNTVSLSQLTASSRKLADGKVLLELRVPVGVVGK